MTSISTGSGVVDEVLAKPEISAQACMRLFFRLGQPSEFPVQLDASTFNLSHSKLTQGLFEVINRASASLTADDLARIRMVAISTFQEILSCNSETRTSNPYGAAGWAEIAIHAESLRIEKPSHIDLSDTSIKADK